MERDHTLPATPVASAPLPSPQRNVSTLRPDEIAQGTLIGQILAERYRVTGLLGAGGMGAVYTAEDLSLKREVALKVVRPALAQDATVVARLVREAQAVAALNHPAIVTVHDAGFRGELPFIVMEKLAGESLDRRLGRGPMTAVEAVNLAARILDALAAAHARGIVHRDIKPANIFLCAPDASPKLLDFGVAAVTQANPAGDAKLTEAGSGVGTPLYMAPEQVNGAEPTARADLYAIGAVLYEAVSGRAPFMARTLPELYAQKITMQPAPVRERAQNVPPAVASVIDAALDRDPERRAPDAATMRTMLLAAMQPGVEETLAVSAGGGLAVTPAALELPAGRTTGSVRDGRTGSTPRGVRVAVALAIAAVTAGVGTWRARGRTGSEGTTGSRAALRAPIGSQPATPLVEPRVGVRTLEQFHDGSGASRALLNTPDVWDLAANDFARAGQQPGAPVRWRSAQAAAEGHALTLRGDFQGAIQALHRAIEIEETWAVPHAMLADALAHTDNATTAVHDAVAEAHRAEELEPGWWVVPSTLGGVYAIARQSDEAIQAYRRARAVAPHEPSVLDGLALALHAAGLDSEADRVASEALALDPDLIWSNVLRAERALERHDGASALESATRAVSVSPRTAAAHLARGDALALLHRGDEARESYQTALRLLDESHQAGLPDERVAALRAALAHHRLPVARGAYHGDATRTRTRAAPAGGRTHAPDNLDDLGL